MANIKKNATELIGGTPLMEVGNFSESEGVNQARSRFSAVAYDQLFHL